jgi:hypothetical protein
MTFRRRRAGSGADLPTEVLVSRVRSARGRKAVARTDSEAWRVADAEEREAIAALKAQFGVQNVTQDMVEWLVERRVTR